MLEGMLKRPAKLTVTPPTSGAISGHLDGIDDEGRVLFKADGTATEAVPVIIGIELSDGALVKAARTHRRAMVVQTADANSRLVLVGLLRERVSSQARDARPGQLAVSMDGETVRLSAERNIELRCGAASLILRKDGKIVISGTNVVSASRGSNRVRGATISLN
jgi:hypothetical protein